MNSSVIKTLVVDDEPLAVEGLMLRLERFENIHVIDSCHDGEQALELIAKHDPDLIFLDLEMPGLTGIDVVEALSQQQRSKVIFLTAYKNFALEAFELEVFDYLVKPVSLRRLDRAISRVTRQHNNVSEEHIEEKKKLVDALELVSGKSISEIEQWLSSEEPFAEQYPDKIIIKNNSNEKLLLPVRDIIFIEAAGDYMCISTADETYVLRSTMKKLISELDPKVFQRIHKSTIVNIHFIEKITTLKNKESIITISGGKTLKVSRNYQIDLPNNDAK